ncbi:hypothetical protein PRUPE_1G028700 [Prunus persica]|uniref:Uncharacterized protein n=1 Tax=Prunus persica TaxID=3760 RepID=A0A251QRU3_PRUPE|nr:hypothetical protein PRUPE_1G028700 [Prunus persica]
MSNSSNLLLSLSWKIAGLQTSFNSLKHILKSGKSMKVKKWRHKFEIDSRARGPDSRTMEFRNSNLQKHIVNNVARKVFPLGSLAPCLTMELKYINHSYILFF